MNPCRKHTQHIALKRTFSSVTHSSGTQRFALNASKRFFSLLLAAGALVLLLYLVLELGTESASGDIAITNVWELQNMSNDLSGDYYLANDIDLIAIK